VRGHYVWHYDGSGPLETSIGPGLYLGREVFKFLRDVGPDWWAWRGEMPDTRGCGSHIHFRVREELAADVLEAWTCLYNTMIEVFPILLPLVSAYEMKPLRRTAGQWAQAITTRMSPARMAHYLEPNFSGREYHYVTPNKRVAYDPTHGPKPLTIEMRLNEAHPSLAYTAAILVNRITRRCFDRRFQSPKLAERDRVLREWLTNVFVGSHSLRYKDAYTWLMEDREIRFVRPIPLCQAQYRTMWDCFDDVLDKYIPGYPPLARVGRLMMARGEVARNPHALWEIWRPFGEFSWEEGPRAP